MRSWHRYPPPRTSALLTSSSATGTVSLQVCLRQKAPPSPHSSRSVTTTSRRDPCPDHPRGRAECDSVARPGWAPIQVRDFGRMNGLSPFGGWLALCAERGDVSMMLPSWPFWQSLWLWEMRVHNTFLGPWSLQQSFRDFSETRRIRSLSTHGSAPVGPSSLLGEGGEERRYCAHHSRVVATFHWCGLCFVHTGRFGERSSLTVPRRLIGPRHN